MSQASRRKHRLNQVDSHSVTVLAPSAQDAKFCDEILRGHGISVDIVTSTFEATRRIRSGAGVLLISQEFLTTEAMDQLRHAMNMQPSWSDMPVLVLLSKLETSARVVTDLLSLGNVTLMERPVRIALLISTLKAKLRDRARQYEVRELLHKAQSANNSKSAFVANISHEIRTPMTSILGYTELVSSLVDNEEAQGYLSTIRRNGEFLLGIINDILDLSKIEAGKFDIDIERFDPTTVIEDVRSVMEIRAGERGLQLAVEYVSEIPKAIESDSKRLKQILINLVGNAIKFTNQGSVKIVVRFSESPAPGEANGKPTLGRLKFDIIDSGIGMTSEQQKRLFKPFSQGDSTITQQFGGTGLGLTISQRLAAMLDGEIGVDSTVNEGSTFTLTIATSDVKELPRTQPTDPRQLLPESLPLTNLRIDAHVLIVDDRRDIRFLSSRIVSLAGGRVTEAEDGVQAIERVKQANSHGMLFDIILLDMQMPNMDGYETASELRKLGFTNPIIALTADAMQGDMTKCINAGCNYHISKPINRYELLQLLYVLSSQRQTGDPS